MKRIAIPLFAGLAAAAVVVVGNELGAGRLARGRLYGNRIGLLSIAVGALVALLVLAVSMWCIAVPLAFLGAFVLGWNPVVVYACTCVDEVGKLPWVLHHYLKYRWVKNLTREP